MRISAICVAAMFVIAAVCIAPLTDEIQNDFVKRYMWQTYYNYQLSYTLIKQEEYVENLNGIVREGIHKYIKVARMGCQDNDGNTLLQY